jgi:putative ABC transport system permease protein
MIRHYILLATKVLLRRKGFTLVSLFGITATLLVFVVLAALLDHGFGAAPPESRQDRMLGVVRIVMYGDQNRSTTSGGFGFFDRYARDMPGVERLTIFTGSTPVNSYVGDRKVSVEMKRTDADFWQVFDFTFVDGRPYSTDDVAHAQFDAVVSRSAAGLLVGGGGRAVGESIDVDGQRFRVVGVVDDVSEMRFQSYAEVWVPYTTSRSPVERAQIQGPYQAVVLASSRDAMPGIRAEFNSRLARVELPPGMRGIVAPFETKFETFARQAQVAGWRSPDSQAPQLILLMAGVGLLIALLPAVNLINLNVSRIMERTSEIGVRKAFGASSRTLVAQFVVENVLLTGVGAAAAFVLSIVVLGAINRSGLIAHAQLALNAPVFLAGVAIALAFGVLSGVYPAWRMSRLHPVNALKGDVR